MYQLNWELCSLLGTSDSLMIISLYDLFLFCMFMIKWLSSSSYKQLIFFSASLTKQHVLAWLLTHSLMSDYVIIIPCETWSLTFYPLHNRGILLHVNMIKFLHKVQNCAWINQEDAHQLLASSISFLLITFWGLRPVLLDCSEANIFKSLILLEATLVVC